MILLRGDGIAAITCGYLLQKAGFSVAMQSLSRPHVPALMLSASSQALLSDVLELPGVFSRQPQIQKRVVKWGPRAEPVTLPHSAVIVSVRFLLESIQPKLQLLDPSPDEPLDWTIISSKPLPEATVEHSFGSRTATVVSVNFEKNAEPATCWIESLEQGWLFLVPDTPGAGWLISVGGALNAQLDESQMIATKVAHVGAAGEFPSQPRIAWPLCGQSWLACGTAALAFDPICGDGTGHAIREAILASAVVRAAAAGANVNELLIHYRARLLAGFKRHLEVCSEFYRSGRTGPWWDFALESLQEGVTWCNRQLNDAGEFRYRLRGFELELIG